MRKNRRGFSAIDLIIAVVAIAVCVALFLPAFEAHRQYSALTQKAEIARVRLEKKITSVNKDNFDKEVLQCTDKPVLIFFYTKSLSVHAILLLEDLVKTNDKPLKIVSVDIWETPEVCDILKSASGQAEQHYRYLWLGSTKKAHPITVNDSHSILWEVGLLTGWK